MSKKVGLDKININLGFIYIFSIAYAYLVSGASSLWDVLAIIFVIVLVVRYIDIQVSVNVSSITLALSLTTLFGIFNYINFNQDLNGDQLYHLQRSYLPAQTIVGKYFHALSYPYVYILQAYSIAVAVIMLSLHVIYEKHKYIAAVILIVIFLAIYPICHSILGLDIHPPLRYLPVILSGVFPDAFGFRAQGLISIFILLLWIFEKNWTCYRKLLFLAFALSLPVIYFNSAIVEFSIWSFVIQTIFLVTIVEKGKLDHNEIVLFSLIISLGSLIRLPIIADYAILGILILALNSRRSATFLRVLLLSIPVFVLLIHTGGKSPATYIPAEVFLDVPEGMSLVSRVFYSIHPGNMQYIWATSGVLFPIFFVILLAFLCQNKSQFNVLIVLGWVAIYWAVFHVIRPVLWGVPRYQAEYIAPIMMITAYFSLKSRSPVKHLLIVAIAYNAFLIFDFVAHMPSYRVDYRELFMGKTPYISEVPYNINVAIKETYAECDGGNVNFTGDMGTYGTFSLILSGITTRDYFHQNKEVTCSYYLFYGKKNGGYYNEQRNTTVLFQKTLN